MSESVVVDGAAHFLFGEGAQAQQIESWRHATDLSSSRQARKRDADTKRDLGELATGVVAKELLGKHNLGVTKDHEGGLVVFALIESWERFDGASMTTRCALEGIGFIYRLFVLVLVINAAEVADIISDALDVSQFARHLEQERLELDEHGLDRVSRRPSVIPARVFVLWLEQVQTDVAAKDIRVGDVCHGADLGWANGVVLLEANLQMEDSTVEGSGVWSTDVGVPHEEVILGWGSSDAD